LDKIPRDNCKFSPKKTIGAQNFNFAPRFPKNDNLSAINFSLFNEDYFSDKKISQRFSIHLLLEALLMMVWQSWGRNILTATWGRTLTAARTRSDVNRPATFISNIDSQANLCTRFRAS